MVSWRLIFFVNVPAGAAALVLLARAGCSPRREAPFDWPGQATAALAMGGLTYGAIEAGAVGFTVPAVVAAFAVAVAALVAFVAVQARGAHPMVPLGLFRSRTVSVPVAVGFAFIVGYYGLPFVMSLYLQQGAGPVPAGRGGGWRTGIRVGGGEGDLAARPRAGPKIATCCGVGGELGNARVAVDDRVTRPGPASARTGWCS